jgi:hypothetical protein
MGTMKLSEYQADLASALGRTLDSDRTKRWIFNAMVEFGYAFKFPELITTGFIDTVDGTDNYVLPTDFRAFTDDGLWIGSPQDRTGGILEVETRTNYLRNYRFPVDSSRGRARAYHRFGNKIIIRPIPDSTVTRINFDYWKRITPLSGADDVSPFTDDWDDIIFRGALYRGHLSYGEHDRTINVFNLFLGAIRSRVMAEDLEEFPEGGISAIESRYAQLVR